MADNSKIEWTATRDAAGNAISQGATWNVVTGCTRVSEGCRFCYAERLAATRMAHLPAYAGLSEMTPAGPRWTGVVRFNTERLDLPLRWRRPRMIFVNSQSDLFHESLPFEQIAAIFGVMAACPQHVFQVLTKRPERMLEWFGWMREFAMEQRDLVAAPSERQTSLKVAFTAMGETHAARRMLELHWMVDGDRGPWPLPNVWLGVSAEDQATAEARIPLLLQCPAAVRWVSAEPLLGPIDLRYLAPQDDFHVDALDTPDPTCQLDWCVVGGESGPAARPMHPDWARSLRDQCEAAGVAFFFKQFGEWAPTSQVSTDGPTHAMTPDGVVAEFRREAMIEAAPDVMRWEGLRRVGKRSAGRLLDGRTWDEMPATKALPA